MAIANMAVTTTVRKILYMTVKLTARMPVSLVLAAIVNSASTSSIREADCECSVRTLDLEIHRLRISAQAIFYPRARTNNDQSKIKETTQL